MTIDRVLSLKLCNRLRLVQLRGPAQSLEVATGLFITRGRFTPLEVSTRLWTGRTPTWRGTSTGRTANHSSRSVHRLRLHLMEGIGKDFICRSCGN